jgi:hypothetical protein
MPSFEPRPFPPSSLTGVPIEYITQQLHNLASQFWDKPETADCTISMSSNIQTQSIFHHDLPPVVPFPHAQGRPELPALELTSLIEPSFTYAANYEHNSLPRRATQPPLNAVPRISMPVRFKC